MLHVGRACGLSAAISSEQNGEELSGLNAPGPCRVGFSNKLPPAVDFGGPNADNEAMSQNHRLSRREFLRVSRNGVVVAGAGLALPNLFLNRIKAATGESPNEFIRVGFIGCGGQGNSNIRGLMKNCVALCDVDKKHLRDERARSEGSPRPHHCHLRGLP